MYICTYCNSSLELMWSEVSIHFLVFRMQHKNDKSGVSYITRFKRALNKSAVINTLKKKLLSSWESCVKTINNTTNQILLITLNVQTKHRSVEPKELFASLLPFISLPLMNCTLSANHRHSWLWGGGALRMDLLLYGNRRGTNKHIQERKRATNGQQQQYWTLYCK